MRPKLFQNHHHNYFACNNFCLAGTGCERYSFLMLWINNTTNTTKAKCNKTLTSYVWTMYNAECVYLSSRFTHTVPTMQGQQHPAHFYLHDLTLIPAWISNHMPNKVWDEITYPFLNFNGCTVEVYEWISNFIPHIEMDVNTYPCWD